MKQIYLLENNVRRRLENHPFFFLLNLATTIQGKCSTKLDSSYNTFTENSQSTKRLFTRLTACHQHVQGQFIADYFKNSLLAPDPLKGQPTQQPRYKFIREFLLHSNLPWCSLANRVTSANGWGSRWEHTNWTLKVSSRTGWLICLNMLIGAYRTCVCNRTYRLAAEIPNKGSRPPSCSTESETVWI